MSNRYMIPTLHVFVLLCVLLQHDSWAQFQSVRGQPGFWRIVQNHQGVWWFLSPDGQTEFLNTVTTVQPYQQARQGPHYVSRDWHGPLQASEAATTRWADKTVQRIYNAGFKGIGAWSHPALHAFDIPMTKVLNLWQWAGKKVLLYDPHWARTVENAIQQQVIPLRDNRNLVGYYTDNELGFKNGFGHVNHYFNGLPPDDPNRREVINVIRSRWPDIVDFNKDWQTHLQRWNQLSQWEALPEEPLTAKAQLASAWRYQLARDYFNMTSRLLKKYDPNHLNLGIRYKGHVPREILRGSKGLTDAQSINMYASDARLDRDLMQDMQAESDAPIIISEYSFHALDGNSGNQNTYGFIWGHVLNQQARITGYQTFITRLASLPYIIGADWFQWNDEPPAGRSDGEDVNFGIVDIYDRAYDPLVQAIRQTTPHLNRLHAASMKTDHHDIWRQSSRDVTAQIHEIHKDQIQIDGHLHDWTETYAFGNLHHVPTIGVEHSDELQPPRVYAAWSETGIYVAAQILSKAVDGYPIDPADTQALWRSRSFDSIELWLSTKPVAKNQWWFDRHTHNFLFVPDQKLESGGTLMQGYYMGEKLNQTILSPVGTLCKARYDANSYSMELFIPRSLLYGYVPQAGQNMAGNIFIRNWKPSIAYFWSAYDTSDPKHWGRLQLVSP